MKKIIVILIMLLVIGVCGCAEKNAKELYETAKFEELQNNPEHAKQLYREILDKYPDTETAVTAKERLVELDK